MTLRAQIGFIVVLVLAAILVLDPFGDPGDSDSAEANAAAYAIFGKSPASQRTVNDSSPDYYPPAPSTAAGMTPQWREFADRVDRTCAESYNYALAVDSRVRQISKAEDWTPERAEAGIVSAWSDEDLRISIATGTMGPPPERAALFSRWRANVTHRGLLFKAAAHAAEKGRYAKEDAILDRIHRLKTQSDVLGQRFGLRICTSN